MSSAFGRQPIKCAFFSVRANKFAKWKTGLNVPQYGSLATRLCEVVFFHLRPSSILLLKPIFTLQDYYRIAPSQTYAKLPAFSASQQSPAGRIVLLKNSTPP